MSITLNTLKQGLLVFWSLWLTVVTLTNIFSWLKALGVLRPSWTFASRNYQAVQEALAKVDAPGWLATVLFAGVILWESLAMLLFWSATVRFPAAGMPSVIAAFAVVLGLFAAFMLADEILREYPAENDHRSIFIALIASLLLILLLV